MQVEKPLNPDLSMAARFLQSFNEDLNLTFQVFDDSAQKRSELAYHLTANFESTSLINKLIASNTNKCGVYFMLNRGDGKGRTNANVTHILGLVADLDGAPLQPVLECGLEPHFINESSPGKYQVFWLINPISVYSFDPDPDKSFQIAKNKFTAWQKALATKFNADPSVTDLARVFRIPGFYHNKKEPFKTWTVETGPLELYELQTVVQFLELESLIQTAEEQIRKPLLPINTLLTQKVKPNERHDTLRGFAYKYIKQGLEPQAVTILIKGLNQSICNPPIDRAGEIEKLVSSAFNKIQQEKAQKPEVAAFKVQIASSWLEEPIVETEPILENLFGVGDKVLIVGKSKTRKSFFALQLALCISGNRRLIGLDTKPKKVLMIQFEVKPNEYHKRCVNLSKSLDIKPQELSNFFIANARGVDLSNVRKFINDCIDEVKPEVVVLDPFYKLIEGDESKIEDVKPILRFFDHLAEVKKVAVIFVHHDKKGDAGSTQLADRGSGTSLFGRDVDCGIYLSEHRKAKNTLVMESIARNHIPQDGISIEFKDYRFQFSDIAPEKSTAKSNANKAVGLNDWYDRAIKMIAKEISYGTKEISMGLFNAKLTQIGMNQAARKDVKELLANNNIIEIGTKKSGPGGSNKPVYLHGVQESTDETSFEDRFDERF